jgi:hypothetical protein
MKWIGVRVAYPNYRYALPGARFGFIHYSPDHGIT